MLDTTFPDTPIDGYRLEYWVAGSWPSYRPYKIVATYHVNTAWIDHPWGQDDKRQGAPFVHQWTIERMEENDSRARAEGRAGGWRDFIDRISQDSDRFSTRDEAVRKTLENLQRRKKSAEQQLAEVKAREAELIGSL